MNYYRAWFLQLFYLVFHKVFSPRKNSHFKQKIKNCKSFLQTINV